VLEHALRAEKELQGVMNSDEEIRKVEEEIEKVRRELSSAALGLSGRRRVVAKLLEDKVDKELSELGMKNARFRVQFTSTEAEDGIFFDEGSKRFRLHRAGMDLVEFLITANEGEEPRPLRKVVSGGELSRIMLALKTIFSVADRVETMVFDEIDAGVSGETALIVGRKLHAIAETKQILCITHLPSIAAKSRRHFTVMKEVRDGRTLTLVRQLDDGEKLLEIARIMKGRDVTEATMKHARELIDR
jgi:DNA repair protein RecN (Recombination protein N)